MTKEVFCHNKQVFVATTKMILVAAPANDTGQVGKGVNITIPIVTTLVSVGLRWAVLLHHLDRQVRVLTSSLYYPHYQIEVCVCGVGIAKHSGLSFHPVWKVGSLQVFFVMFYPFRTSICFLPFICPPPHPLPSSIIVPPYHSLLPPPPPPPTALFLHPPQKSLKTTQSIGIIIIGIINNAIPPPPPPTSFLWGGFNLSN